MPKTVEVVIAQLYEDMDFNTLITWADLFKVEHDEYTWFDDEWPDKESELRQKVTEAAVLIFEKGNKEYRRHVLGELVGKTCRKCHVAMGPGDDDLCHKCKEVEAKRQ